MSNDLSSYTAILIHGWGGSKDSLTALSLQLQKKNLSTVILELPGHGETKIERPYRLTDLAEYVAGKLPSNRKLILIGHSIGGKIITKLASDGKISDDTNLVLINASGIKPVLSKKKRVIKKLVRLVKPLRSALEKIIPNSIFNFTRKVFYKLFIGTYDYQKTETNPALKQTFLNVVDEHFEDSQLKKIKNPTLIIWGGEDKDTPIWMGNKIAEGIENSKLEVVEGATHGLPIHQPGKVSEIIINFLKDKNA